MGHFSRSSQILVAGFVLLVVASPSFGHGGGLDGYGCHHNRKAGGYDCHQGPLAGQAFSNQREMHDELTPGLQPYSAGVEAARPKKSSTKSKEGAWFGTP